MTKRSEEAQEKQGTALAEKQIAAVEVVPELDDAAKAAAAMDEAFKAAQLRAQGVQRISQLHLVGEGHSFRGVRLRELLPTEIHKSEGDAAKLAGEGASLMAIRNQTLLQCLFRMVVAVTTGPVRDVMNGEAKWEQTTLTTFSVDGGWDRRFTPKDTQALGRVYNRQNECSLEEVDLLAGKLTPVTTGG